MESLKQLKRRLKYCKNLMQELMPFYSSWSGNKVESLVKEIAELKDLIHKSGGSIPHKGVPNKNNTHKKGNYSYQKEFKEIRIIILMRDSFRCQDCGSNRGDYLDIHHIIYQEHGGSNSPENLVTLCKKCHAECHKGEPVYNLMLKSIPQDV